MYVSGYNLRVNCSMDLLCFLLSDFNQNGASNTKIWHQAVTISIHLLCRVTVLEQYCLLCKLKTSILHKHFMPPTFMQALIYRSFFDCIILR